LIRKALKIKEKKSTLCATVTRDTAPPRYGAHGLADNRENMKHASNYTCTEYRQEMILLGLKRQLESPGLPEAQRMHIAEKINELERQMGMD
jgi:hypothetical protein